MIGKCKDIGKITGLICEVTLMKDFSWKIFAIKTIIFVQYIDSITGFSSGNGYHTNHMDYIFESPLVYMGVVFCINIILAIAYLIYCFLKAKRE